MPTNSTTTCSCCLESNPGGINAKGICAMCAGGRHTLHCKKDAPAAERKPDAAPASTSPPSEPARDAEKPAPAPASEAAETKALEVAKARAVEVVGKGKLQSFGQMLQKALPKVEDIVPRGYSPQRLFVAAYMAVERNPKLLECTATTVLRGVIIGAQLGLDVSGVGGLAYLVPFKNKKTDQLEAQFVPGWRGLADLACRSGRVAWILPGVVRERDFFSYEVAPLPSLVHRPSGADAGEITHFYATAAFRDGSPSMSIVMTKAEVDRIREKSKARGEDVPWNTDYPEMGKKTAVRRICKYLPSNPDLERALAEENVLSDAGGFGFDADHEAAEIPPPKRLSETKAEAPAS